MNAQGISSFETVARMEGTYEEKEKYWNQIKVTLSRQLTLRICSCIQIASKIHSFEFVGSFFCFTFIYIFYRVWQNLIYVNVYKL